MFDHHALGLAGGAARIDHIGELIGAHFRRQLSAGRRRLLRQRGGIEQRHRACNRAEPHRARGIGQHRDRVGIFQHFGDAVVRERGIDGRIGAACLEHSDLRDIEHRRRARQQQRDDALGLDQRCQVARKAVGQFGQFGIRHHLPFGPGARGRHLDCRAARIAGDSLGEEIVKQFRLGLEGSGHRAPLSLPRKRSSVRSCGSVEQNPDGAGISLLSRYSRGRTSHHSRAHQDRARP